MNILSFFWKAKWPQLLADNPIIANSKQHVTFHALRANCTHRISTWFLSTLIEWKVFIVCYVSCWGSMYVSSCFVCVCACIGQLRNSTVELTMLCCWQLCSGFSFPFTYAHALHPVVVARIKASGHWFFTVETNRGSRDFCILFWAEWNRFFPRGGHQGVKPYLNTLVSDFFYPLAVLKRPCKHRAESQPMCMLRNLRGNE